jgi:hypothetical protein
MVLVSCKRCPKPLILSLVCAGLLCACSAIEIQESPIPVSNSRQSSTNLAAVPVSLTPSTAVVGQSVTAVTQTDTTQIALESAGVAARFPEPAVTYNTPAFQPGRTQYTSNAELHAWLHSLVRDETGQGDGVLGANVPTTTIRWLPLGNSQVGEPLEALHFSRNDTAAQVGECAQAAITQITPKKAGVDRAAIDKTGNEKAVTDAKKIDDAAAVCENAPRPVVLIMAQQHGNEPAGCEALMIIAQELAQATPQGAAQQTAGTLASLLDRIDVIILPRANPDGAARGQNLTANRLDLNQDHLLLRTPEAQAINQLVREFKPVVVIDTHEYTALDPALQKLDTAARFDALIQYATVANLPEFITRASEEWFRRPLLHGLKAQGLSQEWYHTASANSASSKGLHAAMGSVQPNVSRNVHGLRNAISFLIETRGADLGRAHFKRRVHTHVTAIASVLSSAAARAQDLRKLRRFVDADVTAKACRGDMVIESTPTPSEYVLTMLNPVTGADKVLEVSWESALSLTAARRRTRPCGYWLSFEQLDVVQRLQSLGVRVHQLDESGTLRGETFMQAMPFEQPLQSSSVEKISMLPKLNLVSSLIDSPIGSYYVGLDQPLANLITVLLEPDTASSFAASRLITDLATSARVLVRPNLKMTALP